MFANILLLSLLTIIYGTKGEEGGGGGVASVSQIRPNDDRNSVNIYRPIRTPFRNTEIMAARGFGKRDEEYRGYNENYSGKNTPTNQQANEDYRDAAAYNYRSMQKQLLFPFSNNNQFSADYFDRETSNMMPQVKAHRRQIRDGGNKFRFNDGGLRNARGFGKRSLKADTSVDNFKMMQFLQKFYDQNQELSSLPINGNPDDN